ncbi:hypothetical protein MK280_16580 [Myxococcota bacterium]|nr:hypothetical protein [Myxococcota bacterium]
MLIWRLCLIVLTVALLGSACDSEDEVKINEIESSIGPSFRNVLGLLPFGQELDDPLEPLPQNFVAQRLQGLTTSPIATGGRLLNEFFAFGPDESGANP